MWWLWFSEGALWDSVRLSKEAVSSYSLKGKVFQAALSSVWLWAHKTQGAALKSHHRRREFLFLPLSMSHTLMVTLNQLYLLDCLGARLAQ